MNNSNDDFAGASARSNDPESYIAWARANIVGVPNNLARSGLASLAPDDFAIDIAGLPVTVEDYSVLSKFEERVANRYGVPPENVIALHGTSHGNLITAMTLIEPGCNVIVETPAYEPVLSVFQYFNVEIRRLPRRFEDGFLPCPDDLESLTDGGSRILVLTNLHNPSGAYIDEMLLVELAAAMKRCGGYVLVDEVYLDFMFENAPPPAAMLAANIITTSSLTKVYGLGTLRLGWAIARPSLIAKMRPAFDRSIGNPSFPSLLIGIKVFDDFERFVELSKSRAEKNRAHFLEWLEGDQYLETVVPRAGIISFPRLKEEILERYDTLDLFNHLRDKYNTTIVPGKFFDGMSAHFRLGIGAPLAEMKPSLENLGRAFDDLSSRRG